VHSVQSRDFDEDVGSRGEFACDDFEIAQRSEERCAAAFLFTPSWATGETEGVKKARDAGRILP